MTMKAEKPEPMKNYKEFQLRLKGIFKAITEQNKKIY
jgi:hypothetical protein